MSCVSPVPEMPISLTVTNFTNTTITITWSPPEVLNGILGEYNITYMGYKENNDVRSEDCVSYCFLVLPGMAKTIIAGTYVHTQNCSTKQALV